MSFFYLLNFVIGMRINDRDMVIELDIESNYASSHIHTNMLHMMGEIFGRGSGRSYEHIIDSYQTNT